MCVDVRHIQECELIIAEELKRICDKHGIQYFLVAGSLLGAVRHQGFIPWDDDMDFGMLRSEYDRFCTVRAGELDDRFYFQNWNEDLDYPFSYGKLMLKGTHINEVFAPEGKSNQFIFVDIFPYDNVPGDTSKQEKQAKSVFWYRRILWMKKGYGKYIKKKGVRQFLKYMFGKAAFSLISYNYSKNKLYSVLTKYNACESAAAFMDSPYSYKKSQIKKEWLKDMVMYKFDGHEFPGFMDYDEYLTGIYGEYMQLPPEEKRGGHEINSVDFGPY